MNITITTPPPFEPVTLAEVWKHLRLDPDGSPLEHPDDAMLERHITTARQHVESMTRRALVQQTVRLSMGAFPVSCDYATVSWRRREVVRKILLHRPPIIRVESVSYFDGDNALQTLDAADYYTTDEQVPELRFASAFSAPTIYDRPDAVRVTYVAGYAPEGSPPVTQDEYRASVPMPLRDAILAGVQLLYDDLAAADADKLERMREALVQPYRIQLAP